MARPVVALAFLAVAVAGCLTHSSSTSPPITTAPSPFAFSAPSVVTAQDSGSEPSVLAARDGSLYVVGVLGSVTARGDGLWKSVDGGATWRSLGKPDYPFGGGDADIDEDAAGRLYLPGQWRPAAVPNYYITGGESMATSTDGGEHWTVVPSASELPVDDRQWTATYGEGHAWLAFNQAQRGLMVTHSADGGLTWTPSLPVEGTWDVGDGLNSGGPNGIPGDWVVDSRDGTLFLPYAPGRSEVPHRLIVSTDGGNTFLVRTIHTSPAGEQPSAIFGTLAMDTEGGLYYAWAETVDGGKEGMRIYVRFSSDRGVHWSEQTPVTPPGTTTVFPWIVAGAPGHVAVGYYGATGTFRSDQASAEQEWYPLVAMSRSSSPSQLDFEQIRLGSTPNHRGPLCTGGTSCDPQFRRLGDFFELGLTPQGEVVAAWIDDTKESSASYFVRQTVGSLAGG